MEAKAYNHDIKLAIKALGKEKIACLKAIFENLQGTPPQLACRRFRADHPLELNHLDELEHSFHLIKQDERGERYNLSPYALPLIQTSRSEYLIENMSRTYNLLRKIYNERLNKPITSKELCENLSQPKHETLEALHYLTNISGVWSGKGNEFPYNEDSILIISENILGHENLHDFFHTYHLRPSKNSNFNFSPKNLPQDRIERFIQAFKNHPIRIFIGFLIALTIALGSLTNSIDSIISFLQKYF